MAISRTEFNALKTRVTNLESGATTVNTKLAGLQTQINTLTDRVTKLELETPPPTALFSDMFPTDYTISGGQKSPDGKWLCEYTGGGKCGTRLYSDGKRVLFEYPATSTATDGKETHASLVKTVPIFTNFEAKFKMRTIKQLRQNFPVKNWEAAWIAWSYSNRIDLANRSVNHYYFVIKNQGVEFGKKDNIETNNNLEEQIFLPTVGSTNLVLSKWYDMILRFKDFKTTIIVDGVTMVDYTDTPNNPARMKTGSISLYNEDSEVEFSGMTVNAI